MKEIHPVQQSQIVILSGGEAGARNRTYAESVDAAKRREHGPCSASDPVHRMASADSRTVARSAFCTPHDDVTRFLTKASPAIGLLLLLSSLASAQTLTGTVKDATTGKAAAGDEVVLLSLGQGMEEAGSTKADAKGSFSFKLDDAQSPHLVRAIHQGVTYHRMAPPGTTSVELEVDDVGKKIDGIEVIADVMRIQVEQGQLEIMRQFAVQNSSKPPRTQMNEHNLEFYVPEGAQIAGAQAMTENGQPVNSAPVPEDDKKTRYAFLFPLRPGITQFEVAYQVPYTGSANIDPKSIYPLQHFVVMLPKAIQFSAAAGTDFQLTPYPKEPEATVEVASGARAGQSLAFRISGEGAFPASAEGAPSEGGSAQADSRPGGGLGPPIDAPDPLHRYQLPILIGMTLALVAGGVYIAFRQQVAARASSRTNGAKPPRQNARLSDEGLEFVATTSNRVANSKPPRTQAPASSMLLEGLKEELFQLEVEHKQGRLSQQEYEKAKAALDFTLERALKRGDQRT